MLQFPITWLLRADHKHLFLIAYLVTSYWYLEISCGGNIYTTEISKEYQGFLLPSPAPGELVVKRSPAHQ